MHLSTRDIILTYRKGNESVHAFPKGISLKDNVIVTQEFKNGDMVNGKAILVEEQQ